MDAEHCSPHLASTLRKLILEERDVAIAAGWDGGGSGSGTCAAPRALKWSRPADSALIAGVKGYA